MSSRASFFLVFDWVCLLAMLGFLAGLLWERKRGRAHGPNWAGSVIFSASFAVSIVSRLVGENPLGWMLLGAASVGIVISGVLLVRAARASWRSEMDRFRRS